MREKKEKILIVDDEVKILDVVKAFFEAEGYEAFTAENGNAALSLFDRTSPDLLILDIMLPDVQGDEICSMVRKKSKVPIIMLTARIDDENIVRCLDLGADDYVTKPFSPRELVSRVRAALRRVSGDNQILANILSFNGGELQINTVSHEVFVRNNPIALTPVEYKLLILLCKNPKRVFTRDDLIIAMYGYDYDGNDRAIDTHIKNLRHKVEEDSKNPKFILTVHGVGYKFGGE